MQGVDLEIGSQISFPNFIFSCTFLYLPVAWRNEKNISTWYYGANESKNQFGYFRDFHGFSWRYAGHPHTEISSMTSLTPKPSIFCYLKKLQYNFTKSSIIQIRKVPIVCFTNFYKKCLNSAVFNLILHFL